MSKFRNILLWAVQILLAFVFILTGSIKLFAFNKFATTVPALAGHHWLVTFIGISEIAGAVGIVLPRLLWIAPILTTWAALGLATIMALATGFHLLRSELSHAIVTVSLLALALIVVWGRGFQVGAKPR